jgi:hypothetical protein
MNITNIGFRPDFGLLRFFCAGWLPRTAGIHLPPPARPE